jgi:hypothetical protein
MSALATFLEWLKAVGIWLGTWVFGPVLTLLSPALHWLGYGVLLPVFIFLNPLANWVGAWVLAPIGMMPGWVSATIIAVVTGLVMLVVFKYTSNQKAIKAARDDIKAQLLSMKLFKDRISVTLQAQGRILLAAWRLFVHALLPMAVMCIPVTLVLTQLGLWYQARPLGVGEEALVTVTLNKEGSSWPKVALLPNTAVEVITGPVRVQSKGEAMWILKAKSPGYQRLEFQVGDKVIDKELAIGDGLMRVSLERPDRSLESVVFHPWEAPFADDAPVKSIAIEYPTRSSWIYGTDTWVFYWFGVSLVAAFLCRGLLGVNV